MRGESGRAECEEQREKGKEVRRGHAIVIQWLLSWLIQTCQSAPQAFLAVSEGIKSH